MSVAPAGSNPLVDFTTFAREPEKYYNDMFKEAAGVLADEMTKHFGPDGGGIAWSDTNLKALENGVQMRDKDDNPLEVSPEARKAAGILLKLGGVRETGNFDELTGPEELRKAAEQGLRDPGATVSKISGKSPMEELLGNKV